MINVRSSVVRGFEYDPVTLQLSVEFNAGGVYRYDNVPHQLAVQLCWTAVTGASVGSFLNHNVFHAGFVFTKIK